MIARWFIHEPNTAPIAPHNCSCTSCGNGLPEYLFDDRQIAFDNFLPIFGVHLGVVRVVRARVSHRRDVFKFMMLDAQNDVAIHLDKAAIAVIGKARIAALRFQPFDRFFVEAQI